MYDFKHETAESSPQKEEDIKVEIKTEFDFTDFLKQKGVEDTAYIGNYHQKHSDITGVKQEEDPSYFPSLNQTNEQELNAEFFYKAEDIRIEIKDEFIFVDPFDEEDNEKCSTLNFKQEYDDSGAMKKEEYISFHEQSSQPNPEIRKKEEPLYFPPLNQINKQFLKGEFFHKTEEIKIEIKDEFIFVSPFSEEDNKKFSTPDLKQENSDLGILKKEEYIPTNQYLSKSNKKPSVRSTKNIVKNFGRAMINFALSHLAVPYLVGPIEFERISFREFALYLTLRKDNMDGISSLRALLLVSDEDTAQVAAFKRIFQYSCEVFIKVFSVNWICHSKLADKMIHLKSRFRILRRIRDPKHFTYFR